MRVFTIEMVGTRAAVHETVPGVFSASRTWFFKSRELAERYVVEQLERLRRLSAPVKVG